MSQPSERHNAAYLAASASLYAGNTERPPTRDEIATAMADAVEAALAVRPVMFNEAGSLRCRPDDGQATS